MHDVIVYVLHNLSKWVRRPISFRLTNGFMKCDTGGMENKNPPGLPEDFEVTKGWF
jgi:hypothetical protein